MKATKPTVRKTLQRAGFTVTGTTWNDRQDVGVHVTDRFRGRVRVFVNRPDNVGTRDLATPDANGFHWEFTEEWVEHTRDVATRVARALRADGFDCFTTVFEHRPVNGGEVFVQTEDC